MSGNPQDNVKWFSSISESLLLLRLFLLGGVLLYIVYGFFFETAPGEVFDPLSSTQRYIAALILLFTLGLSYTVQFVKENLETICIYLGLLATLQTTAFVYTHGFPLNHANSIIVVVVFINLVFSRIKPLIIYNIVTFTAVVISLLVISEPKINPFYYLIALILVMLISFWTTYLRRQGNKIIKEQEKKYRELVENTPDIIFSVDKSGSLTAANSRFFEQYSLDKGEILGKKFSRLDLPEEYLNRWQKLFENAIESGKKQREEIHITTGNDGEEKYFEVELIPLWREENIAGMRCMQRDVTRRKKAEKKLRWISFHDELTGLPNRSYLTKEMERLNEAKHLPVGVILADVNGLKIVNDAYGHDKGDELLKIAADVLKKSVRGEDIAGRWAGDEFLILLPNSDKKEIQRVKSSLEKSFTERKLNEIEVSASLGQAVKEEREEKFSEVIERADEDMYEKKLAEGKSAKNNIVKGLIDSLHEKSCESRDHCSRLVELGREMGEKLNLSSSQLDKLSLLANLHDAGMITISEDILKKPEELTKEEWKEIKSHPETGYRIAAAAEVSAQVASFILTHHERWDGGGYPGNLQGNEIPLLSRVFAIIDSYEAMTSERPYSPAVSRKEAIKEIEKCAGSQFDPNLSAKFVKMMS